MFFLQSKSKKETKSYQKFLDYNRLQYYNVEILRNTAIRLPEKEKND